VFSVDRQGKDKASWESIADQGNFSLPDYQRLSVLMFPGFLSVFLRTLSGFLSFCRSVRLSAFCLKRREKGNMESLKGKVIGHILCSCCHAVVLDQIATSPKGMKWKAVKRDGIRFARIAKSFTMKTNMHSLTNSIATCTNDFDAIRKTKAFCFCFP